MRSRLAGGLVALVMAAALAVTLLPATAQVAPTDDQYGEPCPPRGNNGQGPGPGPGRRVGPQGCRPVGPPPGPGRRVGPNREVATNEGDACTDLDDVSTGGLCGVRDDDRIRGGPGADGMDGGREFDKCNGDSDGPNTAVNCERVKNVPFPDDEENGR